MITYDFDCQKLRSLTLAVVFRKQKDFILSRYFQVLLKRNINVMLKKKNISSFLFLNQESYGYL